MLQIWTSRIWLIFDYSLAWLIFDYYLAYLGVLYEVVSLSITRVIFPWRTPDIDLDPCVDIVLAMTTQYSQRVWRRLAWRLPSRWRHGRLWGDFQQRNSSRGSWHPLCWYCISFIVRTNQHAFWYRTTNSYLWNQWSDISTNNFKDLTTSSNWRERGRRHCIHRRTIIYHH